MSNLRQGAERAMARVNFSKKQEIPFDTPVESGEFHSVVFYDAQLDEFGNRLKGVYSNGYPHDEVMYGFDTKVEVIQELLSVKP